MGGDNALRFAQVELDHLGVARGPHYFRGAKFVVWFSGPFGGIFATAPQRMADLDQVSALFGPFVTRAKRSASSSTLGRSAARAPSSRP